MLRLDPATTNIPVHHTRHYAGHIHSNILSSTARNWSSGNLLIYRVTQSDSTNENEPRLSWYRIVWSHISGIRTWHILKFTQLVLECGRANMIYIELSWKMHIYIIKSMLYITTRILFIGPICTRFSVICHERQNRRFNDFYQYIQKAGWRIYASVEWVIIDSDNGFPAVRLHAWTNEIVR